MKKNSLLVGLFFTLLFFGLFLGDGKQWAIDVYGATLAIVVTIYSLFVQKIPAKKMPKSIVVGWLCVAVSIFVSTIFSDSVGYSISWIVRLLSGALLYRVFYNIASYEVERDFVRALVLFVGLSSVLFFVIYLFPSFNVFPSMSLLGANYGHSHFADLLVLVAPILLIYISANNAARRAVMACVYVGLLYITRARGAVLVICVYALLFGHKANGARKNRSFVYRLFMVVLCGFLGLSAFVLFVPHNPIVRFIKTDAVTNRIVYWRQAVDVFVGRPMFGSGPGTFSLSSVQKQRTPWVSSWFAHSAPLQMLSELGILGLIAFGWLFVVHKKQLSQSRNSVPDDPHSMLAVSVSLLLIYSCFEYVLDYFVIWMMFWAMLGLLTGAKAIKESQNQTNIIPVLIGVLGVFYALWVSSFLVTLTIKRADIAFYLAPFDSVQALMFLETNSIQQPKQIDIQVIDIFHRKNHVILDAISKLKERQGDDAKALLYAKKAAYSNPQNSEYYIRYFSLLARQDKYELLGSEILSLGKAGLPNNLHRQVDSLAPYARGFGQYYKDWVIPERATFRNGYASLFYRLGIADLRDVEPTERLLILARDIYPDLAYLHIELAAFYEHVRKDHAKAEGVLVACQQYKSAAQQCKEQLDFPLYLPSEYKNQVM